MSKTPHWKILDGGQEVWQIAGPASGIVQILDKESGKPIAAFAVESCADFSARLRPLVASIPKTAKQLQAKVVATAVLTRETKSALSQLGVAVLKTVEREGAFEIRYFTKEQKLMVTASGAEIAAAPTAPAAPASVVAAPVAAIPSRDPSQKIRTLIVDDSPTIRKLLERILSSDPQIEVVGSVGLPSEVDAAIQKLRPEVITLDIHLPEMNGVELLKQYLPKYRIPTVMISSISMEEGPLVLNALEAGAVDYVQKPSAGEIASVSPIIIGKVKMAANARLHVSPSAVAPARRKPAATKSAIDLSRMIVIGSSTGGTEALKEVFIRLPEQIPPILVVQHIPSVFSKAFADRLNSLCPFEVVEGVDGEAVTPNKVIIAPGGKQMHIKKSGSGYVIVVDDSEPVNRHKPSVDVLFDSVVKYCGPEVLGLILTGMGADGAKGLLEMKKKGCFTIGQDEASCVVFGMPQAAMKLGATGKMVPLLEIADVLMEEVSRKKAKKAG